MLRKLYNFLFSFRLTAIILFVFGLAIGVATFIENDFGSSSARAIVYNARWFEVLLIIGIINLIGIIVLMRLYRKEKFTVFLFHLSFVFILIGAAITRFSGETGMMHIRQDDSKNYFLSDELYVSVSLNDDKIYLPAKFSQLRQKHLNKDITIDGKDLTISTTRYEEHCIPTIEFNENGRLLAEMVLATDKGRQITVLEDGQPSQIGNMLFTLNADSVQAGVKLYFQDGALFFISPFPTVSLNMFNQQTDSLPANEKHIFAPRLLYNFDGNQIVLRNIFATAKEVLQVPEGDDLKHLPAGLEGVIHYGNQSQYFALFGAPHQEGFTKKVNFGGEEFTLEYGSKQREMAFSISLKEFILKRYVGSNSPQWFESKVILRDEEKGIEEERRIFMNNVLKHRGYRFYQSSYDDDELGTVLSVNKDLAGTMVSYLGYLLMAIGMLLSLVNKNSRFANLFKQIKELNLKKSALILLVGFSTLSINAQESETKAIDVNHAKRFGELLIMDKSPDKGGVVPINTYASEMIRKISRKQVYKGLIPEQVLLGVITDPANWQNEPMIKVSHPELQEKLHLDGKYASFNQMFTRNTTGEYLLSKYVEEAYQKKAAERSKFDNEVMKVDERLNILYMAFTAELLNVFPVPNDETNTWVSHTLSHAIQTEDSIFTKNIFRYYVQSLRSSVETGDYGQADTLLNAMKLYQQKYGADVIPSQTKLNTELLYNRLNIFDRISSFYGLLGFILLLLQFIAIFIQKFKIRIISKVFFTLIILLFTLHTAGLIARWYISGYAPWSNGYETLVFISWGIVLVGMIFNRYANITISSAAILAYFLLHVAHLSWMDPTITNLVPVLDSYWLLIHVAVITLSYAFFAIASIIGLINLLLYFFVSEKNKLTVNYTILELTAIIEIILTVGLYMLTIGTFLGGVWANESWGRYWAWDPKETWALVTILAYAFIAHMRMIPGLRSVFLYNVASMFGLSFVIMTYFGVNYYLSGLHSYAAGDPLPIPDFVIYTVLSLLAISVLAYINKRKVLQNIN
jgi:cytochrome c-type biogenesis protein CcsB